MFHRVLHDVLDLLRIARVLASGLHDYGSADIKRRVQTGVAVDILPPEESPLEQPQVAASLLESLRHDPGLSGFAKLSRHLMAAVTLPRSLESATDIPTGGVSDISNRGQLHKLLLSDLAFDEFTLAVRIASNEAMYIRRKSPPNPTVENRAVLIDNSLPMWGLPKLYATATAMALSADADKNLNVVCFRPSQSSVVQVSLGTRAAADQLSSLSPAEHAGEALHAFETAIRQLEGAVEPVVITTSDTLGCAAFKCAIDQTSWQNLWIIVVERDGGLSVLQRTRQGTSLRRRMKLQLEDILSRNEQALQRASVLENLPDIFRRPVFPFRFGQPPLERAVIQRQRNWFAELPRAFVGAKDVIELDWRAPRIRYPLE